MLNIDYEIMVWFAMRATYKRLFKAQELLNEQDIENYIPMRCTIYFKNRVEKRKFTPVISNLIFVKTSLVQLEVFRSKIPFLIPIRDLQNGKKVPMVVRDIDMERFIKITSDNIESVIYIDSNNANLAKGTRVRVIDGEFKGYEGVLTRVKGVKDKRVVVSLAGLLSVAMVSIDANLIEKI